LSYGKAASTEMQKAIANTEDILKAMRDELLARRVEFYIVAIPSKAQTVQSIMEVSSCMRDQKFESFALKMIRDGLFFDNPEQQFLAITTKLHVNALSLLPVFRARDGNALFYQFDRHWNALGQQTGAAEIFHLLSQ
jgi:hypothetical protein